MPKTWNEKLNIDRVPQVETMVRKVGGGVPGMKMLIPTPREVRDYVRSIPAGETRTVAEMRGTLAKQFGADITCPLVSGIFIRIVAEAAMEDISHGSRSDEIAPFWRIIAPGDKVVKKLTFDPKVIVERRLAEGIKS